LALVRSAKLGDEEATSRLLELYLERVVASARLGGSGMLRVRIESRTIVREVLLAAILDFDGFELRDEGTFILFLPALVVEKIQDSDGGTAHSEWSIDHYLPDASRTNVGPTGDVFAATDASSKSSPGDLEETDRVAECIRQLPDEARELILMRN